MPAHGMRRISFVPKPAGFRFYHTHVVAGGDLNRGTYTGQVGPLYIEPKNELGAYDREVFLVLKEFAPSFSRGGGGAPKGPVHLANAVQDAMRILRPTLPANVDLRLRVSPEDIHIHGDTTQLQQVVKSKEQDVTDEVDQDRISGPSKKVVREYFETIAKDAK